MAAVRRGQEPMKLDLPTNAPLNPNVPPISALFLIYFDTKAGYTIAWRRSLPGVELEGVVEYKSLPSGLHNVEEDLIYFVHGCHAGLSAFVNAPAAEEARNARMIAVGVLVPLSYGRLGRSWKHADKLKEMALELVLAPEVTKVLEDYWETHKADDDKRSSQTQMSIESPVGFPPFRDEPRKGHSRKRSESDGTVLMQPGHNLSTHHPAWSLSALLSTFGPLIFPLHRAALLRRRILIVGHAPVQETCDFVYNISVLSNIPLAVTDLVAPSAPPQRLRPLFSIGVHDIPFLEDDLRASLYHPTVEESDQDESGEAGRGWIACTTDDILKMKDNLYDVLIVMPPPYSADVKAKVWPKMRTSRGIDIKATQRDLRRYRALKWGLSRSMPHIDTPPLSRFNSRDSIASASRGTQPSTKSLTADGPLLDTSDADSIVESLSWSALAYSGFMWWASAGEQRLAAEDEGENDSILLAGLLPDPQTPKSVPSQSSLAQMLQGHELSAMKEMAIIAYFHRLTTLFLTTLSDIVDSTNSDDEQDDTPLRNGIDDSEGEATSLYMSSIDIAKMGLDEWSASDHKFIEELVKAYFGRKVKVEGVNMDICGIKIC